MGKIEHIHKHSMFQFTLLCLEQQILQQALFEGGCGQSGQIWILSGAYDHDQQDQGCCQGHQDLKPDSL